VTYDHKAGDADEQARVKAAGGEVFTMYVGMGWMGGVVLL
jgi:hypothetical protein